ncbi:MAG: isoamylase early set domain-containing protein [Ferruginibacter sp.]|nr:isoamylase early set domain-containing protein [Cytophagales bacterium]
MIKKKTAKGKTVCKVTFEFPPAAAEGAKQVQVLGDFNNWDPSNALELKASKNGGFSASIDLESGREYAFRYLVDGVRWENDWEADKYVSTDLGIENSVVVL